jgi:hypothetical protein
MALTYTWKIDMMHTASKAGLVNAVTEIHWSKTGTNDGGISGRYPGVTRYDVSAIADSGFTPLAQLTEEQVLDWVRSGLSDQEKVFIDAKILGEINHQTSAPESGCVIEEKMPWAAPAE